MGAPDILGLLAAQGLTVRPRPDGNLDVSPRRLVTDEIRGLIRENKAALLEALTGAAHTLPEPAETRRGKVVAMLRERPGTRYAILTDIKNDAQAVIVALAIRDVGTCELRIPCEKWDGVLFLEMLERHTVH